MKQLEGVADWADQAALLASAACMVHCLALPLVIAAAPTLSSVLALPETFHVWVLALAVPAAAVALLQGWIRHRAWSPVGLGVFGLTLLTTGALFLPEGLDETLATVGGSLSLAAAHIHNWRLRRACRCSGAPTRRRSSSPPGG